MKTFKRIDNLFQFDEQVYSVNPIFISCNKYWDGGITSNTCLKEKAEFYNLCHIMSNIIKEIILAFGKVAFVGKKLCENQEIYAHWSDLKSYKLFREITQIINPKKYYEITLPEDNDIIDLIVESNFCYFSYISLYLPEINLIITPSCHTEVLLYTKQSDKILDKIRYLVKKHSTEDYKIKIVE